MLTQLLAAAFLLGFCIFFHELGHFLLGKLVGIRVKIFSIGYGRGIIFKRFKKTIYQITAIPLGGYVQFYGDDPTKTHKNLKKGDFFAASPYRRIASAFGGPGFSILLGFLVIFTLISAGWQPITNKILLAEGQTPARSAGLSDNDKILSINGKKTDSFESIYFYIGLASSSEIKMDIERDGKIIRKNLIAHKNAEGGQFEIGIRPSGTSYLQVSEGKTFKDAALLKNDKIIEVAGKPVHSIETLRDILKKYAGEKVEIKISRKDTGVISNAGEAMKTLNLPVELKETLKLTNITDTQTGKIIPDTEFGSWEEKKFSKIFIKSNSYSEWGQLKNKLESIIHKNEKIHLSIGAVEVSANIRFEKRGLLGVLLSEGVDHEKAALPTDLISITKRSFNQTWFTTQTTLVGLYRLIQGKLSFRKSVSGPVKIMAIAAKSVDYGWDYYFFMLAQITIILGIMNLLPIPVLDGGHIIFYLIEAFYKPLPPEKIAVALRISTIILITFGVYVIGQDIWDVFIKGIF